MNSPILHLLVAWATTLTRVLVEQTFLSAVIFIPVLLLSVLLRRRSPRLLLGLWMLVLVRLLLPSSFTLPTSLHRLWLADGMPLTGYSHSIGLEELSAAPADTAPGRDPVHGMPLIVVLAWLSGVVLLLRRQLGRIQHHRRFLQNAQPVQEPWINDRLQAWQRRLRLHRRYRLLTSDSGLGACVSGLFNPVVHIPQRLIRLNDRTLLECVLAHELAHIKRRDYLLLPLQALVQMFYFFNPLIWIAASRINLLRECACDSLVLEQKVLSPQTYAAGVLRALRYNTGEPLPIAAWAALGQRSAKFKYRIEHMKGEHTMSRFVSSMRTLFLLLVSLTVLPMAQEQKVTIQSPTSVSPAGAGGLMLVNPLSVMKVTLSFGPARHPYTGETWHHQGIDLAAAKNTEVHACAGGKVLEAVSEYTINKGAGRYVTLQHENGYASRYTHLHTLNVKQGDLVKAGETIATVGTTGLSTGPHLHFEWWQNGKPVDPTPYLQAPN